MSDFYLVKERMSNLITGDMARETLELAEDEYLQHGDYEIPEDNIIKHNKEFQPVIRKVLGVLCERYYRDEETGWMGTWQKGDIWFNKDTKNYEYIPDFWHLEDVRLDDIIYRPIR